jgi:LysM repeat protein
VRVQDYSDYSSDAASAYSSHVTTNCATTAAPIATPGYTAYLSDNNTSVTRYSTPTTCTGATVPVATNADCDSFAMRHGISTDQLLAINGLTAGCANFPGGKTSLCIEGSCQTYTVKANDTCTSIALAYNLWPLQLRLWNPFLDPACNDLARMVGHVICVSNPNGYTTPAVTETVTSTSSSLSISSYTGVRTPASDLPSVTTTWTMPPLNTTPPTVFPLANGSLSNCYTMWDNPFPNFLCMAAAALFGVSVDLWLTWNTGPLNGGNYSVWDCTLQQNMSYCGSYPDPSLIPTVNLTAADPPAEYIAPPRDSTAGATTQCIEWYETTENDTCAGVLDQWGISLSDFYAWNPAIGMES